MRERPQVSRRTALGGRGAQAGIRKLLDESSDVHYSYNFKSGKFVFLSQSVKKLTGYRAEDFGTDPQLVCRLLHPDDHGKLQQLRSGRAETAEAADVILRWLHRNGGVVWAEHRNVFTRSARGRVSDVTGTARDVSSRMEREATLRETAALFRNIVAPANQGIWVVDAEGKTTYVNERMAQMLGHRVERMVGRFMHEYLDESTKAECAAYLERIRTNAPERQVAPQQLDIRFRKRGGSDIWAIVSAHPVFDANGQFIGAVGVVSDLCEVKLRYGSVEVDLTQFRVYENQQEVDLTVRESLLLRYLIQHRGRVISRFELLRELWGITGGAKNRTVDVHVSHLRKKLPSIAPRLVAIGTSGYMLREPSDTADKARGGPETA